MKQPPPTDSSITVGIPSYNRGEVLCRTLSQILPRLSSVVREVIVADQCPVHPPDIVKRLETFSAHPKIRYLLLSRPGLTVARNAILASAQTELLVFLDDDVIIPDGFFDAYQRAFLKTGAQVIQGQVIQIYGLKVFDEPAEALRQRGIAQFRNESACMKSLDFFIGANHAVRRSRALEMGGYDEHMSCGAAKNEEADFIIRASHSIGDIFYAADCWLIHYSSPSGGVRPPPFCMRDEWKKSYTDLLWCFRHGRRLGNQGALFWKAVRRGPLRRGNVLHFWHQPWAWLSFAFAALRAFLHRHEILGISPDGSSCKLHYSPRPCPYQPQPPRA